MHARRICAHPNSSRRGSERARTPAGCAQHKGDRPDGGIVRRYAPCSTLTGPQRRLPRPAQYRSRRSTTRPPSRAEVLQLLRWLSRSENRTFIDSLPTDTGERLIDPTLLTAVIEAIDAQTKLCKRSARHPRIVGKMIELRVTSAQRSVCLHRFLGRIAAEENALLKT